MSLKQKIIDGVLAREGEKYTNNPKDSGGPTKWGITEKVARAWGYAGDMRELDRATAFRIYEALFWTALNGDRLEQLSPLIAEEVVDTAVNQGVNRAVVSLQRCLNVLNLQGELYPDLKLDGGLGSKTLAALAAYLKHREEEALWKALNSLQGAFYIQLAESRAKDEEFVYGWLRHRVGAF